MTNSVHQKKWVLLLVLSLSITLICMASIPLLIHGANENILILAMVCAGVSFLIALTIGTVFLLNWKRWGVRNGK